MKPNTAMKHLHAFDLEKYLNLIGSYDHGFNSNEELLELPLDELKNKIESALIVEYTMRTPCPYPELSPFIQVRLKSGRRGKMSLFPDNNFTAHVMSGFLYNPVSDVLVDREAGCFIVDEDSFSYSYLTQAEVALRKSLIET